jgi:hypothetical protein
MQSSHCRLSFRAYWASRSGISSFLLSIVKATHIQEMPPRSDVKETGTRSRLHMNLLPILDHLPSFSLFLPLLYAPS